MLIHLARLNDAFLENDAFLDLAVEKFETHASMDRVGIHRLTESPEEADVILFTQCHMLLKDWRLARITRHPLRRAFPEKTMVYNEFDRPWCALPGVYVSMPGPHFVAEHQRAWAYLTEPPTARTQAPDLLFSFIASNTTTCRRPLFALKHPHAVVEEVQGFQFWDAASERFEERRARFTSTLARSRFVLCPRGNGTSSVRLYEAMAVGAVPVIIADDWVPPVGPEWETFSIRWPEGQVAGLIEILEARDGEWSSMSERARRAYNEYFSPEVGFHHVAELCRELVEAGSPQRFPTRGVIDRWYAELALVRSLARAKYWGGRATRLATRIGRPRPSAAQEA